MSTKAQLLARRMAIERPEPVIKLQRLSNNGVTIVGRLVSYEKGAPAANPKKPGGTRPNVVTVSLLSDTSIRSVVEGADDTVLFTKATHEMINLRTFKKFDWETEKGRLFVFTGVGVTKRAQDNEIAATYKRFADAAEAVRLRLETDPTNDALAAELAAAVDERDYDGTIRDNGERSRRAKAADETNVFFTTCSPFSASEAELTAEMPFELRRVTPVVDGVRRPFIVDVDFAFGKPVAPGSFVRDEKFGFIAGKWDASDPTKYKTTYNLKEDADTALPGLRALSEAGVPCSFPLRVEQMGPNDESTFYVMTQFYDDVVREMQYTKEEWVAIAPNVLPNYRGLMPGFPKGDKDAISDGDVGDGVISGSTQHVPDNATIALRSGITITKEELLVFLPKEIVEVSHVLQQTGALSLSHYKGNTTGILADPAVTLCVTGNWQYDDAQRAEISAMTPEQRKECFDGKNPLHRPMWSGKKMMLNVFAVHPKIHELAKRFV